MPTHSLTAFIWSFIRVQRWVFLAILFTTVVWAIDQTVWPVILQVIVDAFGRFEHVRSEAWPALRAPLFWSIGMWLGVEIGFRIQGFLLARALPRLEAQIRLAAFNHVQRHSPKYFHEHLAGSLANKINDLSTQVSHLLRNLLMLFIPSLLAVILACLFLFRIHAIFAGLLLGWVAIHLIVTLLFSVGCDRREHTHAEDRSHLSGKIVDSLTNYFAVNLFYRFNDEMRGILPLQAEEQRTNEQSLRYMEWMRFAAGIFGILIGGVVINGLLILYWMHGEFTTGQAVQIFNTVWNITMVMWIASAEIPQTFQAIGVARQGLALLHHPQDIADVPEARPLQVSRGEIVFDDVSFQYGHQQIFTNKTVRIAGGSKVGLVGFSGAGKSTFIALILRLYATSAGRILIDGQDVAKVTLESLRHQIAVVPQTPLLFHRSILDNLRFGRPEASEEAVVEAATRAHCMEFISKQPKGLRTVVGERGAKLSGGECQRVTIARALLADCPLLILDEATSSLDSVTEKYIQSSLHTLMQGRTSIVIAHRLSTLEHMDRILVFDQGKIIEDGSHAELLRLRGHYARMWHMQAGGFLPDIP